MIKHSINMKQKTIVQECLDVIKKEDIQKEIRKIFTSIINIGFLETYPYVYFLLIFLLLIFTINLATFILILVFLRNK